MFGKRIVVVSTKEPKIVVFGSNLMGNFYLITNRILRRKI